VGPLHKFKIVDSFALLAVQLAGTLRSTCLDSPILIARAGAEEKRHLSGESRTRPESALCARCGFSSVIGKMIRLHIFSPRIVPLKGGLCVHAWFSTKHAGMLMDDGEDIIPPILQQPAHYPQVKGQRLSWQSAGLHRQQRRVLLSVTLTRSWRAEIWKPSGTKDGPGHGSRPE